MLIPTITDMLRQTSDNHYRYRHLQGEPSTRPDAEPGMQRTEREIWQNLIAGKEAAWKELVERFEPLVYAVAVRAGLSMSDAADCFQQTFVQLYLHRHRITDPTRLSAWLVTTAKREAIRLARQAGTVRGLEAVPEQIDGAMLPDEVLSRLQQQAVLENALGRLDERCRALLRALFFSPEELTYEQVAESVGIAFNSLGPIRGRCLQRLRKILEE